MTASPVCFKIYPGSTHFSPPPWSPIWTRPVISHLAHYSPFTLVPQAPPPKPVPPPQLPEGALSPGKSLFYSEPSKAPHLTRGNSQSSHCSPSGLALSALITSPPSSLPILSPLNPHGPPRCFHKFITLHICTELHRLL